MERRAVGEAAPGAEKSRTINNVEQRLAALDSLPKKMFPGYPVGGVMRRCRSHLPVTILAERVSDVLAANTSDCSGRRGGGGGGERCAGAKARAGRSGRRGPARG